MILTHPLQITSRLLPGIRIGDSHGHGWLAVQPDGHRPGDDGRRIWWTVYIDAPAGWDGGNAPAIGYRSGADGISTGAQYRADGDGARAALAALCSFLGADAESFAYGSGNGPDGDGYAFPPAVAEWANHFSDEIAMIGAELDGEDTD